MGFSHLSFYNLKSAGIKIILHDFLRLAVGCKIKAGQRRPKLIFKFIVLAIYASGDFFINRLNQIVFKLEIIGGVDAGKIFAAEVAGAAGEEIFIIAGKAVLVHGD